MRSALTRATVTTFEELGFLFTDPEVDEEQAEAPLSGRARVSFCGPFEGVLDLSVGGEILRPLASNMLGTECLAPDDVYADALGEVANVICGNVLPSLAGPDAVFDLAAPDVQILEGGVGRDRESDRHEPSSGSVCTVRVGVEDGWAELRVSLSRRPAPEPLA